jgi:hypothetical protein
MSMKRFMNKKVAAIGLAAGLVLGGAGAAFAYFTANGNGTGQGTVGSASTWGVAQTTSTGTMLPGSGTSVIEFTVTNNSTGAQAIESGDLAAAIVSDASTPANIEQSGVALSGCEAGWFNVVSVGAPSVGYGNSIGHNGTTTVDVTVSMSDSHSNQDLCEGATPDVSLTVSA